MEGKGEDESYHSNTRYPLQKRRTLFNLYAFTIEDSYQKLLRTINSTTGEEILSIDFDRYKLPTLRIENVEIRNFLYDYQALIYVEKDNYIVKKEFEDSWDPNDLVF